MANSQEIAHKIAQKMFHASNLFLKGKASAEQFLTYLVKNAKAVVKHAPQFNPNYEPQHADETREGLARLNEIGDGEVSDEDLNAKAEDEADENIDFDGGGQFSSEL